MMFIYTCLLRRLKYLLTTFSIYSGVNVIHSYLLHKLSNYAILPNVKPNWVAPQLFLFLRFILMLLSVIPPPYSDALVGLTSYDSGYSWPRFWPGTPLLQSACPAFTYQPQTSPMLYSSNVFLSFPISMTKKFLK
jgi:hypothetical protein